MKQLEIAWLYNISPKFSGLRSSLAIKEDCDKKYEDIVAAVRLTKQTYSLSPGYLIQLFLEMCACI